MAIAIFFFGLIFGSFANVIILRLNTGESLVFKGSRCFFCGRSLRWFELIPVVSFFALRGRCHTCGSKISWQYPAVELASGLLFLLIYFFPQGDTFVYKGVTLGVLVITIFFFWLLLVISVYDLRHKIIPNSLVYLAIAVALIFLVLNFDILRLTQGLLSGLGLFSFFAFLWLVSKGKWMGFGDAKLGLAIGIMLGWPLSLAALLFSFWLGALFGLAFLAIRRIPHLKVQIPFGPFLFLGSLTAFLWGERIIEWYLSLV